VKISKKAIAPVAGVALTVAALAGCTGHQSVQQKEQAAQTGDTSQLENNQPLPSFPYSQIRQTEIDVQTLEANGTQTESFFFNYGQQDPFFSCASIGMPVPITAQLSNPQQIAPISSRYGGGATVIGQMDPNGVYTGDGEGTYVVCLNSSGQKYLEYDEGPVNTVAAGSSWDYGTHRMVVNGAPTAVLHDKTGK
jgi:hypothetical protein